jgi:replication-associated recombination protein RarA
MRGSDPDASVYWMTRMLEAGEDPRFVLRRMVIFASEDVGNADPQALVVATAALQAVELVGLPEGVLPLTQAVTYLALAPKSNRALTTYAATEVILAQQRGEDAAMLVQKHNEDFIRSHERWFSALYKDKYDYLGDFELIRTAVLPDLGLLYLGGAGLLYCFAAN